jgi:lipopolysaccharide export system permease protein|tara:strand:- start:329 stop:1501 length:1173 start_codon:yes stop_codon:yes gene_type:complete
MKKLLFLKFLKDTFKIFIIIIFSVGSIVWVIKAVGFLDIVSEDGHGLLVYLWYTILNFPKIISRILPFIFIIALFYKITEYEKKNELLIFWINGISKIKFIQMVIVYSFVITFIQILLSGYISPLGQDKARSFIRNSSSDFFPSLIKEGKFIDAVSNLTIFINSKDKEGNFNNIFLSNNFNFNSEDDSSSKKSEIIYAKRGILINNEKERYFQLIDGKIINNDKNKIQEFNFEKINYDLSKYISNSTKYPKIQEYDSSFIVSCVYYILFDKLKDIKDKTLGSSYAKFHSSRCEYKSYKVYTEEFLKRFYKPLYIPLLGLISCILILKSKDEINYNKIRIVLFSFAFLTVVISEIALRYSATSTIGTIFFILFPVIIFTLIYVYLNKRLSI